MTAQVCTYAWNKENVRGLHISQSASALFVSRTNSKFQITHLSDPFEECRNGAGFCPQDVLTRVLHHFA